MSVPDIHAATQYLLGTSAAQVAGFGAFVDRRGVHRKLALADVQPQLAGRAAIFATGT